MVIDTVVLGLIKTNCYIVSDDNGESCVIIDPGSHPDQIINRLRERGLTPEYVFITHGHFDHFTAVPELRDEYDFKLVIHELDTPCFTEYIRSHYRGKRHVEADVTVKDGDVITLDGLEFTWLHTPGHNLGSCVIQCGDALFTGDTLFYEECGRCDLFGGSYPNMLKSLRRLADLDGNFKVLPGHGQASALDHERAYNQYMRESMEDG
ncbi:MAG: MBL fold metallo-hydrolase [Oscillospiraceae bacterium]|nr:MBL fold metallo-hydrolase [Oscillospiraceae bacterium]